MVQIHYIWGKRQFKLDATLTRLILNTLKGTFWDTLCISLDAMNENIKGLLVPTPYKRKDFIYGLPVSHIVGGRRRRRTDSFVIMSMAGVGMSGRNTLGRGWKGLHPLFLSKGPPFD